MSVMERVGRLLAEFGFGLVSAQIGTNRLTPLDLAYAERFGKEAEDRDAAYIHYQAYYDGFQADPKLRGDTMTWHDPAKMASWPDRRNFCSVVVDTVVGRLQVRSLTAAGEGVTAPEAQRLERAMHLWWKLNRMDELQITLATQTLVKGDAFVVVGWDVVKNAPTFHFNDALWMMPVYDNDLLTAVYKIWVEEYTNSDGHLATRMRVNKYTDGEILKFVRQTEKWQLYTEDGDGGVVDWTDQEGLPLGVAVIHFRNKPNGDVMGRSELHDITPIQDEINWRAWSAHQGIGFEGSNQKYVVDGVPPSAGYKSAPNTVWGITSQAKTGHQAEVGQLEAGDVQKLLDATNEEINELAAVARTPHHLLWPSGEMPSGEALKTAEAPLVGNCRAKAVVLGNAYEDLMRLATRVHNTFAVAAPRLRADATVDCEWEPFETRAELTDATVTSLIGTDLSRRERLRRAGYTDDQIDQIDQEREDEGAGEQQAIDAAVGQIQAATQRAGDDDDESGAGAGGVPAPGGQV